eukprot:jgi/Botrbrau1/1568/Bobra.0107s0055.1
MDGILQNVANCTCLEVLLKQCAAGTRDWRTLVQNDGPQIKSGRWRSSFADEFLLELKNEIRRVHEREANNGVVAVTAVLESSGSLRKSCSPQCYRASTSFSQEDPHWSRSFPPLVQAKPSPSGGNRTGVDHAFARPVQQRSALRPSRRIAVTKVDGNASSRSSNCVADAPLDVTRNPYDGDKEPSSEQTSISSVATNVPSQKAWTRNFASVVKEGSLAKGGGFPTKSETLAGDPSTQHNGCTLRPKDNCRGCLDGPMCSTEQQPAPSLHWSPVPNVAAPAPCLSENSGVSFREDEAVAASPLEAHTVGESISSIGENVSPWRMTQHSHSTSKLHLSSTPQSGASVTSRFQSRLSKCTAAETMSDLETVSSLTSSVSRGLPGCTDATSLPFTHKGLMFRDSDISQQVDSPELPLAEGQGTDPVANVEVGDALCRLAKVHSALLRTSFDIALLPETTFLLHVISRGDPSVSLHARACDQAQTHSLFCCSNMAAAYACMVLEHTGNLLAGLSMDVLKAIVASPVVGRLGPGLLAAAQNAIQTDPSQPPEQGSVHLEDWTFSVSHLFSHHKPEHSKQPRMPEELARSNNWEACRDAWMSIMREAAGNSQHSSMLLKTAGDDEAAYRILRARAPSFLDSLRPDNYRYFALLFVSASLQAATTGEAFPDDELSRLAIRDFSKFARLQERMKGKVRDTRTSSAPSVSNRRLPKASYAPDCSNDSKRHPAVVEAFPGHQRLFILFLLATDSYRLNTCVSRCLQDRLWELSLTTCDSSRSKKHQLLGGKCKLMGAVALFLSFMHFAAAGIDPTDRWDSNAGVSTAEHGACLFNVEDHIKEASSTDAMLLTLFWTVRYYWFAAWDTTAVAAAPHRRTLALLAQLHKHQRLLPGNNKFNKAMFCARSVLDDFMERARATQLPLHEPDSLAPAQPVQAVEALARSHVDSHMFNLCCRGLEMSCQALQGSASLRHEDDGAVPKAIRKIRPSQPVHSIPTSVPSPVSIIMSGTKESDLRKLEGAFINLYSESGKVLMKDLVLQVSEVAAINAFHAALQQFCTQQAVSSILSVKADLSSPSEITVLSPASQKNLILSDVNDLLPQAADTTLQASSQYAKSHIQKSVSVSFSVLACPEWTPEVVGTGAAIAARRATAICEEKLAAEVPPRLRTMLTLLLRSALKHDTAAARLNEN